MFFYEIAVPLNLVENSHHNAAAYVPLLRRTMKQHGDGKIY